MTLPACHKGFAMTLKCRSCAKAVETNDPDLRRCDNRKSQYFGRFTDPDSEACEDIVRGTK